MKKREIKKIIIVIGFLVIFFLPILCINRENGKVSVTENRYLASFPKLFDEKGNFISEGFSENLEAWLNDNIGMREQFVELYTNIMVNVLHLSSNEKVEIGKGGWYFYTGDNNLKIAEGTYPLEESEVSKIVQLQQRISNKLHSQGREYVLVLTPAQTSIYPEMVKSGNYEVKDTPIDIVEKAIMEDSDVFVIALKEALLEKKTDEQVFFKTDTHWNWVGAYAAYCELIKRMNEKGILSDDCERVITFESEYLGEMGAMLGNADVLGAEAVLKTTIVEQDAKKITFGEINKRIESLPNRTWNDVQVFQNDSVEGKVALMFGDSKFESWNMPELLAEHFSTFVFVWGGWGNPISQDIIDIVNPDIVLLDVGERYLNYFANWNEKFAIQALTNPSAEIKDIIVDEESITISVKNVGEGVWTREDAVRLCVFADGKDTGIRAMLPEGTSISYGEEYVFELEASTIESIKDRMPEVIMAQEGFQYFGEKKQIFERNLLYNANAEITEVVVDAEKIKVRVKNIGEGVWTREDAVRLCVFADGKDTGIRAMLPKSMSISYGEECVFELDVSTMESIKDMKLEIVMAQEGFKYFGEREEIN